MFLIEAATVGNTAYVLSSWSAITVGIAHTLSNQQPYYVCRCYYIMFYGQTSSSCFESQSFSSCFPTEHVDVQIRVANEPKS
jgi:hypothetical protein